MIKKRGLGIGLNELLSDIKKLQTDEATIIKTALRNLPLDVLQPGKYQPRRDMDQTALEELAASIRARGIIQPLVVRELAGGSFEIIAGERRWRAAQLAALPHVPAIVREITDEEAIAISLIENIQREALNAIETAYALQRLIDEFTMTHETVAITVGKSRATVSNMLRLLSLPDEVKNMLARGELEMGHARAIITLDLPQQLQVAKIVVAKKLSVRATERLVKNMQNPSSETKPSQDINILKLQQQISDKFGAKVLINHSKSGKGKIMINYNNLDELDGILEHLGGARHR